jgi:hypothetical protein
LAIHEQADAPPRVARKAGEFAPLLRGETARGRIAALQKLADGAGLAGFQPFEISVYLAGDGSHLF